MHLRILLIKISIDMIHGEVIGTCCNQLKYLELIQYYESINIFILDV